MSRLTAVSPILGTRKKSGQHSGKKVAGRDTWAGLIRFAAIDHAARTPTKNGSVIVRALHNAQPISNGDGNNERRLGLNWGIDRIGIRENAGN